MTIEEQIAQMQLLAELEQANVDAAQVDLLRKELDERKAQQKGG